jgi:hypothetical protein
LLEKEAQRIISLLPKMLPGKQRGRAVNVPYSIPINFQYLDNSINYFAQSFLQLKLYKANDFGVEDTNK